MNESEARSTGAWEPSDVSPLSSQAISDWGSPLVAVDAVDAGVEDEEVVSRGRFHSLRTLAKNPKFVAGFILFGTIVSLAILAPVIARYSPDAIDYSALNQNPSAAHWLGADYLGRDMWARLVMGGRTSLVAGLLVVALSFVIGVPWGLVAGFGHRFVDDGLMRVIDVLLAFPGIVLVFAIVAILGAGIGSVVVALGIGGIPAYARVARASTLSTKERDFVDAARAQGAGALHILNHHVFPNIVDPLVTLATLNLAGAILATTALSFLGIGTQPPAADWGTMLANGFNYMFESWAQVVFPALFIIVTVFGINLMGDAVGEVLNRQSQRG